MAPARIWKLPLLALLLAPTLTKGFSAETVSTRDPLADAADAERAGATAADVQPVEGPGAAGAVALSVPVRAAPKAPMPRVVLPVRSEPPASSLMSGWRNWPG